MILQRIIGELCILKHRASATENEQRAATHLLHFMRTIGLTAHVEEFKSQQRYSWELIFITTLFLVQAGWCFVSPLSSIIIGLIGLTLFWGHFTTRFKPLAFLFRFVKSQNVVGRKQNKDAPFKIIFTAHYDSARSGLLWHPKNVSKFRFNFLFGVGIILTLFFLCLLKLAGFNNLLVTLLISLCGAHILGQIIVLLSSAITGKPVEGASDNASGVAVMLELARRLKKMSFPEIEFWFVATGSEEVGAIGMTEFLKAYSHEFNKRQTFFINIDNNGSGNLHYYLGEGMLNFYKFSPKLIEAAEKTAKDKKFKAVTRAKYTLAYTDAIVPASRGFQAILLLATDDYGLIPNWHWHTDTIDNINIEVPKLAADFCLALINNLKKELDRILVNSRREKIVIEEKNE